MIKFKDFKAPDAPDKIEHLSGSLGIKRKDMPQVRSKNIPDYMEYLRNNGVKVSRKTVAVKNLKITQREKDIDEESVRKLFKANKQALAKPVLISSDNHILDGHHRITALYNMDKNFKLKVVKASMPIKKLLDLTYKYPKVYKTDYK